MRHAVRLQMLQSKLADIQVVRPIGRICAARGNVLNVSGLNEVAKIGDRVEVTRQSGETLSAEIVQLSQTDVTIIPDGAFEGIALGDRVTIDSQPKIAPNETWLGRIVDPNGTPLDGRPLGQGFVTRPLKCAPPAAATRRALGARMNTGHVVFDTMLPIVRGQRMGLFAGSGVGKSSLMGQFAKRMSADIVVIAMIGERGREVRHFVDDVLGSEGLQRSVIVAATSDQSPLLRRRCAWTAMAVAEHFRDEGLSVLLLADSITRFAEAHREVAVAAGEAPVLRGFPASTSHMIMSLCERAGPGGPNHGDITAVFSVLVAGSDMDEPIADILRGVLDGHVVLDRSIAERGRFPAVDVLRSVSRSLPGAATTQENEMIAETRKLLGSHAQNQMMISAGLYTQGTDPDIDTAIQAWPHLDKVMSVVHEQDAAHSFDQLALALRRGGGQVGKQRSPR
ncbi:FliI/YscN family ATPase [uncultured Tateyamaria sp.]|uniref:FliI/YscN family ATPase n=1 Tax=uncultured Tateyamaria sp. TaxID=455651 RepID=UPI00260C7CD2|nr:FliI/YscN family ATPase [uncultured Tateyamaria sp.]